MRTQVLGRVDYLPTYEAMRAFTDARSPGTDDELWLCEHPPVFTQGLAGKAEHVLAPGDIPVVATNRGGQVTYHGPGQVVAYPLLDLHRRGYFVKEYVFRLEEAVLRTLAECGVTGHRVTGAPGIYVRLDDPFSHRRLDAPPPQPSPDGRGSNAFEGLGKIAALGVKVSRHCTYHGLALNVAMDLQPFSRIHPCGYAGLATVDLSTIGVSTTWDEAAQRLGHHLHALLT
ncbi:lipoyl(octanoyl) transferase LipB [Ramlibacter algicola]|uniref:Octanoyltransferase n=1 Tax=Ramlibacter algicola TaxID=2795217 RepID=A0A934UPT1_9BURK|nr:lipoyl(octanoyl) transferase LipB [Ramlibacter algicola]MBK0391091.1 lipoyl(octanoyl) transferase LipB [Ramlibacter algicola]